jgi:hypothetical protein
MYYLFICLCCLFSIDTVRSQRFRESPWARCSRFWGATSRRARQVTLDHIDPMYSLSLSSVHIGMHALILYLSLIFRIWVHTWLVMLSHVIMSVVQVFPFFGVLSLACVFVRDVIWPWWGSMLWFEQGWNGGDGWILSGDVVGHARIC